jgi:hypothetical protein
MRECPLSTSASWNVYALFNHDLGQIFVGAMCLPMSEMGAACRAVTAEMEAWEPGRHRIEVIEAVEQFPTERHCRSYAGWLMREGAFEGLEDYAMGLDAALA